MLAWRVEDHVALNELARWRDQHRSGCFARTIFDYSITFTTAERASAEW